MRKNPYIKNIKSHIPLFMAGPSNTSCLTINEEQKDSVVKILESEEETYYFNSKRNSFVGLTMVRPALVSKAGVITPEDIYNVEMLNVPVTRELFREVMGWDPSHYRDDPETPVEEVSFFDCIDFCNKISLLLGFKPCYTLENIRKDWRGKNIEYADVLWDEKADGFRLPTEKEWMAFAKSGTENRWAGTDNVSQIYDYAYLFGNSRYQTQPVFYLKPNEWGLYDMTGNVDEWCWDPVLAEDENDDEDEGPIYHRVVKGGDQRSSPYDARIADRTVVHPSRSSHLWGFRICRTIQRK